MDKISLDAVRKTLPKIHYNNNREYYYLDNESLCPCGKGQKFYECCLEKYNAVYKKYSESGQSPNVKIEQYLRSNKTKNIPSFKLYERLLSKKNLAFCLAAKSETPPALG